MSKKDEIIELMNVHADEISETDLASKNDFRTGTMVIREEYFIPLATEIEKLFEVEGVIEFVLQHNFKNGWAIVERY